MGYTFVLMDAGADFHSKRSVQNIDHTCNDALEPCSTAHQCASLTLDEIIFIDETFLIGFFVKDWYCSGNTYICS